MCCWEVKQEIGCSDSEISAFICHYKFFLSLLILDYPVMWVWARSFLYCHCFTCLLRSSFPENEECIAAVAWNRTQWSYPNTLCWFSSLTKSLKVLFWPVLQYSRCCGTDCGISCGKPNHRRKPSQLSTRNMANRSSVTFRWLLKIFFKPNWMYFLR